MTVGDDLFHGESISVIDANSGLESLPLLTRTIPFLAYLELRVTKDLV
jgi:hypothetical protein